VVYVVQGAVRMSVRGGKDSVYHVGEIFHEKEAQSEPIHAEADGSWIIDGRTAVRDVNRALALELPENPAYATVAGLVLLAQMLG
jgi:CBS domain containing-hemolysin-like protein